MVEGQGKVAPQIRVCAPSSSFLQFRSPPHQLSVCLSRTSPSQGAPSTEAAPQPLAMTMACPAGFLNFCLRTVRG